MRRLLLLAGAIVFLDTMFFAALTPLLPGYVDRFDLSKVGAGALQAAYPVGALLGGIPSGLATARLGPRTTAIAGLLLMSATTLAFGLADSVWVLDGARLLQGFASAAAWTAALSWLVSASPAERRGQLIGSAMAAAIVGALFGPVLGGLGSLAGTGVVFGAVGALALGLAAWA
ncbi:MAG: MFS transporter, partial [Actinobacteria bacterium]|nr:MFS transporter [Actinomycetota bacterium]